MYTYWTVGYITKDPEHRYIRIEVEDTENDNSYSETELGLAYKPSSHEEAREFEDWVIKLTSDNILTVEQILDMYEQDTGIKIERKKSKSESNV